MKFFTIGVYNSTENEFFGKLINNQIDTFCDIRQRRGVRGSQYAFVNSNRLQQKLADLKINYLYIQKLAPTAAIRAIQKNADKHQHISAKQRHQLSRKYIDAYNSEILDQFDFKNFIDTLKELHAKRIVFFCVEEDAHACHRSLVTDKLLVESDCSISHL